MYIRVLTREPGELVNNSTLGSNTAGETVVKCRKRAYSSEVWGSINNESIVFFAISHPYLYFHELNIFIIFAVFSSYIK